MKCASISQDREWIVGDVGIDRADLLINLRALSRV